MFRCGFMVSIKTTTARYTPLNYQNADELKNETCFASLTAHIACCLPEQELYAPEDRADWGLHKVAYGLMVFGVTATRPGVSSLKAGAKPRNGRLLQLFCGQFRSSCRLSSLENMNIRTDRVVLNNLRRGSRSSVIIEARL